MNDLKRSVISALLIFLLSSCCWPFADTALLWSAQYVLPFVLTVR